MRENWLVWKATGESAAIFSIGKKSDGEAVFAQQKYWPRWRFFCLRQWWRRKLDIIGWGGVGHIHKTFLWAAGVYKRRNWRNSSYRILHIWIRSNLVICQDDFWKDFDMFFTKKGNFNKPMRKHRLKTVIHWSIPKFV